MPRLAWHEVLASLAVAVSLAVLHTWPLASDLRGWSRRDNADMALNAWALTWVADHLVTAPAEVFEGNIFHPERHTVAFSEPLLVPGLLSVPVRVAGADPVLTYNLSLLTGYALSALAMQLLVWRWTGHWLASLLAGSLFAFNAFSLVRMGQLQAIHAYGLPLIVLGVDAVLRGGQLRAVLCLAGGFVAAAATSGYTTVFGVVAGGVLVLTRPSVWWETGRWRVAGRLAGAAVLAGLLLWPVLQVYTEVRATHGLVRDLGLVNALSANAASWLAAPGRLHLALWSSAVYDTMTPRESLFPGVVATLLALLGVRFTAGWWRDSRLCGMAVLAVAGAVLSFGPATPVYQLVYHVVPFAGSVRAAARFGMLTLMAVAVLAGWGTSCVLSRVPSQRFRYAVGVLLIGLVTVETLRAPVGYVRELPSSSVYRTLASQPRGVVAEMPFWWDQMDVARNAGAVLAAAEHGFPLLNGYSGFVPASYRHHADALWFFPFREASFAMLQDAGVRYIVVHLDDYGSDASRAVAVMDSRPDLRLLDRDGRVRLYEVVTPRRLTNTTPPMSEMAMMSPVPMSDSATAEALASPKRRKK